MLCHVPQNLSESRQALCYVLPQPLWRLHSNETIPSKSVPGCVLCIASMRGEYLAARFSKTVPSPLFAVALPIHQSRTQADFPRDQPDKLQDRAVPVQRIYPLAWGNSISSEGLEGAKKFR